MSKRISRHRLLPRPRKFKIEGRAPHSTTRLQTTTPTRSAVATSAHKIKRSFTKSMRSLRSTTTRSLHQRPWRSTTWLLCSCRSLRLPALRPRIITGRAASRSTTISYRAHTTNRVTLSTGLWFSCLTSNPSCRSTNCTLRRTTGTLRSLAALTTPRARVWCRPLGIVRHRPRRQRSFCTLLRSTSPLLTRGTLGNPRARRNNNSQCSSISTTSQIKLTTTSPRTRRSQRRAATGPVGSSAWGQHPATD